MKINVQNLTKAQELVLEWLAQEGYTQGLSFLDKLDFMRSNTTIYKAADEIELAIEVAADREIFKDAPAVLVNNFSYEKYATELQANEVIYFLGHSTWVIYWG